MMSIHIRTRTVSVERVVTGAVQRSSRSRARHRQKTSTSRVSVGNVVDSITHSVAPTCCLAVCQGIGSVRRSARESYILLLAPPRALCFTKKMQSNIKQIMNSSLAAYTQTKFCQLFSYDTISNDNIIRFVCTVCCGTSKVYIIAGFVLETSDFSYVLLF